MARVRQRKSKMNTAGRKRMGRTTRHTGRGEKPRPQGTSALHSHMTGDVSWPSAGYQTPAHQHYIPEAGHLGGSEHDHPPVQPYEVEYPDGTVFSHTHPWGDWPAMMQGAHGPDQPWDEGGYHVHQPDEYIDNQLEYSHHHQINPDGAHAHSTNPLNRKGGKVTKRRKFARGATTKGHGQSRNSVVFHDIMKPNSQWCSSGANEYVCQPNSSSCVLAA